MPSPLNIPKTYTPADAALLKLQLERMAQEVDAYLRGLVDTTISVPHLSRLNPPALYFGEIVRVDVQDGYTLSMQLPRPDIKNVGKRCGVRRSSTTGEVLIYAVDSYVAGASRYRMANDIHFVEFLFDGTWFPSRAGGGF